MPRICLAAATLLLLASCTRTNAGVDTPAARDTNVSAPGTAAPATPGATASGDTTRPAEGGVLLRTDKQTYRAGESVGLTLENRTSTRFTYNPCTRILERDQGGAWAEVREDRICTMIAHVLEPRQTRIEKTEMSADLPPGRYRVVIALTEDAPRATGRAHRAVSAPVTVTN